MEEKVLFVDVCAREHSRSRELAEHVLAHLQGEVERLDLYERGAFPLDENALEQRNKCLECGSCDGQGLAYARQFAEADVIVIAAPYWDLSFPALFKAYIENINAIGITFAYDSSGKPYGLCRAKTLYYVSTAGGQRLDEDVYGSGYVKALCRQFYGIGQVVTFCAENLDIEGNDPDAIMKAAREEVDRTFDGTC